MLGFVPFGQKFLENWQYFSVEQFALAGSVVHGFLFLDDRRKRPRTFDCCHVGCRLEVTQLVALLIADVGWFFFRAFFAFLRRVFIPLRYRPVYDVIFCEIFKLNYLITSKLIIYLLPDLH